MFVVLIMRESYSIAACTFHPTLYQKCQNMYVYTVKHIGYMYIHTSNHLKDMVRVHIKQLVDQSKQSTDGRSHFATLCSIRYIVHYNNRTTHILHCLMSGAYMHRCIHSRKRTLGVGNTGCSILQYVVCQ